MMAFDAERWHDFYVMSGGAAAALAGLLFVAMSLHARTVMSNLFYRNRAVGMLMSLTTQLLLSAAVLVPDQPVRLLGAEVAAASLFWLGVALRAIFAREPGAGSIPISRFRMWAEVVAGLTWNALFIVSGLSLLTEIGAGLYLLAVVMVFAFGWNIYVAWVLMTEISE